MKLKVKGYEFQTFHLANHKNKRERFIFILIGLLQLIDSIIEVVTLGSVVSNLRLNLLFGCDADEWIDGDITFVQLLKTFNPNNDFTKYPCDCSTCEGERA